MADKAIEPGKKSTERYLPKAAWAAMSKAERKKTDDKKKRESRKGKQFVENTDKAKKARRMAVSYTHLRAHETSLHLVCRLLLEKKNIFQHPDWTM